MPNTASHRGCRRRSTRDRTKGCGCEQLYVPAADPSEPEQREAQSKRGECHRDVGADVSPSEAGQRSHYEKACSEHEHEAIRYSS